MTTSVARAETRIRQLCCLGLGGHAVMPALLEELHDLIPSDSNAFFWTNQNLEFSNLYDENPVFPQIVPVYMSEFYNRRETEVFPSFTQSMRDDQGVQSLDKVLKVDRKAFYKHDFYNLVYRPLGYRHFIRIVLRESGRARGRLHLFRSDETGFSAQDRQRLAAIAPYVAHALTGAASLDVPLAESPDDGLIIVAPSGKVQYVSTQARRLLWLTDNPEAPAKHVDLTLPEGVRRLCHQLEGVLKSSEHAAPPLWQHRNAWGGFTFRAYWLSGGTPEPTRLIGITVSRLEPLSLKLMRRIEQFPLSGRQIQVFLLLASGHSLNSIAERLDVSKHTADYHCREVYGRFDVHSRTELIGKLLAL